MTDSASASLPPDALDRLTTSLLECGGVLSQIVADMARFQAAGLSAPNAVPVPEAAHAVVKDAIGALGHRHSRRDLKMAARVIAEATEAIVNDVFFVDPEWLASLADGDAE